jgi:putative molybdenum carrier protein
MKIISGGQTGVDRAALDVALKHGIECGGWCPAGRLDEIGRIPERYPVKEVEQEISKERFPNRPSGRKTAAPGELQQSSFAKRTRQNVKDSDGTLIIHFDALSGGTEQTVRFSIELQRPHLLIDARKTPAEDAAYLIAEFVGGENIGTLNIAGPRQSEWVDGYAYTFRALDIFLSNRAMSP